MDPIIIMALAVLLFNTLHDTVYGTFSRRSGMDQILAFFRVDCVFSFITILLFFEASSLIRTGALALPNGREMAGGVVLGIAAIATYVLLLLSMSRFENSSTSIIIHRLNVIPSILLSILFLGDTVYPKTWIGIALCVAAIVLLRDKNGARTPARQLWLALSACGCAALMNTLNKAFMVWGGTTSMGLSVARSTVSLIIMSAFLLIVRNRARLSRGDFFLGAASGVIVAGAVLVMMEALKTGMVSVLVPITQISFVFVAAFQMAVGREKPSARKFAAIGLAIVSIAVISV